MTPRFKPHPLPAKPTQKSKQVRTRSVSKMLSACCETLKVVDDVDEVASNLYMFIGFSMNALGHDPKLLGAYLVEQGDALLHPDALRDGPHLSEVAYIATTRGLLPELDELRDTAARTAAQGRRTAHPKRPRR